MFFSVYWTFIRRLLLQLHKIDGIWVILTLERLLVEANLVTFISLEKSGSVLLLLCLLIHCSLDPYISHICETEQSHCRSKGSFQDPASRISSWTSATKRSWDPVSSSAPQYPPALWLFLWSGKVEYFFIFVDMISTFLGITPLYWLLVCLVAEKSLFDTRVCC